MVNILRSFCYRDSLTYNVHHLLFKTLEKKKKHPSWILNPSLLLPLYCCILNPALLCGTISAHPHIPTPHLLYLTSSPQFSVYTVIVAHDQDHTTPSTLHPSTGQILVSCLYKGQVVEEDLFLLLQALTANSPCRL